MKKVKEHYRDEEAQEYQEIVTPPELVDYLWSLIDKEDLKGANILDPCVGPGALIEPILEDFREGGDGFGINSLTVMDIQPTHIESFKKNIIAAKEKGLKIREEKELR